jgi:hypothetical protein
MFNTENAEVCYSKTFLAQQKSDVSISLNEGLEEMSVANF